MEEAVIAHRFDDIHHYRIDITTEYGERETLRVSALNERDARNEATALVLEGRFGLRGVSCVEMTLKKEYSLQRNAIKVTKNR